MDGSNLMKKVCLCKLGRQEVMFTLEPIQQAKQFSTPRMVKMRANPDKAARTVEGTLVSSVNFSEFPVLACCANYLFLFSSPCSSSHMCVYYCWTKNDLKS